MVAFWYFRRALKKFSESCFVKPFIKGKIELRQNNFKKFNQDEICLMTKNVLKHFFLIKRITLVIETAVCIW